MASQGSEIYFWGALLIRPSVKQTNELRAAVEEKNWEVEGEGSVVF